MSKARLRYGMRTSSIVNLLDKWFPRHPDRWVLVPQLAKFYALNCAYHEMTRSGNKLSDPQVNLLSCLLMADGEYAEIGCGGGSVCRLVSETATVHGFDVSPIAIENAQRLCKGCRADFSCVAGEKLPLNDNTVMGSYSFEVFEHVWDPLIIAREMVRITRPGGFILISMPNRFSLDLHLPKKTASRFADMGMAFFRLLVDKLSGRVFVNLCPDIDGDIYPDCDMVSSVVPCNFASALERMGCIVDFWDTYYMCAQREGSSTGIDFQKNVGSPFFKNFGDHLLVLAHKE